MSVGNNIVVKYRESYLIRRVLTAFLCLFFTVFVHSQTIEFTQRTGIDNPLEGVDVGSGITSMAVDIDNDGDFDLFTGNVEGTVRYYKNIGTQENPNIFEEMIGSDNPFDGIDVGSKSFPSFVDLDNNGTLDAFIGATNHIAYYKNTGTLSSPVFEEQTMNLNPLGALTHTGNRTFYPSFVDIDLDDDFDVFIGWIDYDIQDSVGISFYRNEGTDLIPAFEDQIGDENPLESFNELYPIPIFADIDADLDMDVFIGKGDGTFSFYENTTSFDLGLDEIQDKSLLMYPNPAIKNLTFVNSNSRLKVRLFSLTGLEILNLELSEGASTVDISEFSAGIYIVTFDDGIKKTSKKLVIRK